MKIFFSLLLITAIFVIGCFIIGDEGHITIQWLGYHIEISSMLGISVLLMSLVIFAGFTQLVIFFKNIPNSIKKHYQNKQEHDDLMLLLNAFESLYCEDNAKAQKIAKKIEANKNHPQLQSLKTLTLLFNAQYNEQLYKHDSSAEEVLENIYQELLSHEKHKMTALKGLIKIRMNRKRYNDALFYAEKALALNSKTDWLLKYLIKIYMVLDLYEKAEKIIKKSENYGFIAKAEAEASLLHCYSAYANYLISNLDVKKAITALEQALTIDPTHPDALFPLVRLYYQDDNQKQAYKILEKAWKKSPSMSIAKTALNIYSNYKTEKKAKLLENLISIIPENKTGYLVLSELYIEENMLKEARLVMDRILSLHAPDSDICKIMALIETKAQNNYSTISNWLYKI
jgi:uncharacterized membrane-anchored protein